ncbi:HalX domain-containing protein [Natrialba sp. PRR66]|uniref:HalX domain-containing protein n=1 Tax=Natrialba sp. PRR66 TaxID=3098146 RepID=UPI002B1DC612|nr:HalX domain-containing protein [Natrialba sp. PRR66]
MATDTPTVLIVEDEPDLATLYTVWLGDEYETRTASDGTEALDAIDAAVDVVLLDRRMPTLSGDTVLETICERDLDCRVAMVTAVEPDFDIVGMGFDDYLVKPVSKDELLQVVDQLLLRSTYDDQLRQFFSLASKKALLDSEKTDAELLASQEYAALEDRLAVSRVRIDETMIALIDQDAHRQLCREFMREPMAELVQGDGENEGMTDTASDQSSNKR